MFRRGVAGIAPDFSDSPIIILRIQVGLRLYSQQVKAGRSLEQRATCFPDIRVANRRGSGLALITRYLNRIVTCSTCGEERNRCRNVLDELTAFAVRSARRVRDWGRTLVGDSSGFSMQAILIVGGFVVIAIIVVTTLMNNAKDASKEVGKHIDDQVTKLLDETP